MSAVRRVPCLIVVSTWLLCSVAPAQQPTAQPVSNLLTSSLGVLSGGNAIAQDAVLTGTVTITTGTPTIQGTGTQMSQGTVRLVSNASGMTRIEVTSPSGNKVETRRVAVNPQAGESQLGSAAVTSIPLHNLLVDPGWIFPEHLVSRAISSNRSAAIVPAAAMDGTTAIGVESYLSSTMPSHGATLRQMSDLIIFFDQTTLLPVEIQFNSHGDDSLLKIIPTRIVYGNYQAVQGHMVPFHIQRYEKAVLRDDITITGVTLNSGIPTSQYSLN